MQLSTPAEVIHAIYDRGLQRHAIAGLAGVVQRAMEAGDAVAGEILDRAATELAAAAAPTPAAAALDAIDELLALDLIRGTDVPRRFRVRHPLVRRAVYDSASAGWSASQSQLIPGSSCHWTARYPTRVLITLWKK